MAQMQEQKQKHSLNYFNAFLCLWFSLLCCLYISTHFNLISQDPRLCLSGVVSETQKMALHD